MAKGFDAPPTLERSGSEHRRAVTSLIPPSHSSPDFAGWDRLGIAVYSLRLILWLFADNLQISCGFLGGFEEKAYFCGRSVKYRRN